MKKPVRRVRTRAAGVAKSSRTVSSKKRTTRKDSTTGAGFKRGAAGFDVARKKREAQEAEYERKKNTPYGFRIKPGDEAEVVLLDDGEPFFVSLHKVKHNGRWEDEVCIEDTGVRCPLCEDLGKSGSYTMVLTCLDRRPYKVQKGPNAGKTIKNSKKLLFVKGRNLPKFERQYKGKANGNFRGIKLLCRRDGEKEAAMGEDLEFLGRVKESALVKFGDNAKPADYETIFKMPTAKELRERYNLGSSKVAGSEEFEGGDTGEELENVGWD